MEGYVKMKRFIYVLAPVLVLAFSASAVFAQGGKPLTSDNDMTETVGVTVSGGIEVAYVHRHGELMVLGGASAGTEDDDNVIEGQVKIQVDVELTPFGFFRLPEDSQQPGESSNSSGCCVRRVIIEQFCTFPLFVLSGNWLRAWRNI